MDNKISKSGQGGEQYPQTAKEKNQGRVIIIIFGIIVIAWFIGVLYVNLGW